MNKPNLSTPTVLTSKRVVMFIITIIAEIFIVLVPELETNRQALMEIVALLAGAVILTFGTQDTAAAFRGTATKYFDPTPSAPAG